MAQTILVADDSATMRQVVTMAFKGSPYRVVAVSGGEEALAAAYEHQPSVILLDYHLPDRSGAEICRAVKGDPNLRQIPVIMMGGGFHAFSEDEARQSGADDVILKPFRTDDIHSKVNRLATSQSSASGARAPASGGSSASIAPSRPSRSGAGAALRGVAAARGTHMGMPAMGKQPQRPASYQPAQPDRSNARYGAKAPVMSTPRRGEPVAPPSRFKAGHEPTRPAVMAPPPAAQRRGPAPSMAPTPAAAMPALDAEAMRRMVREEVQKAVREEMLVMVKSVLGDLFKEKMLPKLLSYGQERVESIVARDLQVIMERRVNEEIARISGE